MAGCGVLPRPALTLLASAPSVFEIASRLHRFGEGARVKRTSWHGEDCYWDVATVKPGLVRDAAAAACAALRAAAAAAAAVRLLLHFVLTRARPPAQDGLHGRAWGTLTWAGVTGPRREIRGTHKLGWRRVTDEVEESAQRRRFKAPDL